MGPLVLRTRPEDKGEEWKVRQPPKKYGTTISIRYMTGGDMHKSRDFASVFWSA